MPNRPLHRASARHLRLVLCVLLIGSAAKDSSAADDGIESRTDIQRKSSQAMTEIQRDIQEIVGGHFTPDALSPEIHAAIKARALAKAPEYLDAFDAMYLGLNFDPIAQSELYLPSFLQLLMPAARERARASAAVLLRLYDAVMVLYDHASDQPALLGLEPDETQRLVYRMNIRRKELRTLLQ